MSCPINTEDVAKLKMFVQFVSAQPTLLNLPQLKFFKDFIEQMGGKVPEGGNFEQASEQAETKSQPKFEQPKAAPEKEVESDPESEVELDLLDTVIPGDGDATQEMGEENKEPSEEEMDQAGDFRGKAAAAYSNGEFEDAINFYTQAILLNPGSALYFAKRAQSFLKLKKPNAAIRDCNHAIKLNPDNAAAYKFRGRAHRLLGNWEDSAKDLRQACKLDFDDEADEWLKEVTPNAKKLEQHKVKQERKKAEKEIRDRRERVRLAQEANKRAAEENEKRQQMGGEGPGAEQDFMNAMGPDLMDAFNDPEIAAALQDVMTNPASIVKYQNNPKVMNLLKKFAGAAGGGMGGMPGMGGMGGMPGMGGMGGMGGMPGMGGMGGMPGMEEMFANAAAGGFNRPQQPQPPKTDSQPKDFDDGLD